MKNSIYQTLVESFDYITEADDLPAGSPERMEPGDTRYAPGYNPNTGSSYTGDIGDAPNDPAPTNVPAVDPVKKKPVGPRKNPGTRAFQHWLNSKGVKVAIDGIYGKETKEGSNTAFSKLDRSNPNYEAQFQELQTMLGVGTAYNVKPGSGMSINSTQYIEAMKKYGYDPTTGNPSATAPSGEAGQAVDIIPPEVASAPKNDPYWVKGTRYEFVQTNRGGPGGWKITHRPGEFALNGSTRRASSLGYTGPGDMVSMNKGVAQLDRKKNLTAQVPPKPMAESVEDWRPLHWELTYGLSHNQDGTPK